MCRFSKAGSGSLEGVKWEAGAVELRAGEHPSTPRVDDLLGPLNVDLKVQSLLFLPWLERVSWVRSSAK